MKRFFLEGVHVKAIHHPTLSLDIPLACAVGTFPSRPRPIRMPRLKSLRWTTELQAVLRQDGFTGRMESTLEQRLGRRLDMPLADLGRNFWFDTLTGLNNDNACAGCHSPTAGFGDTQSIAIGIDSNEVVGPHRAGPRNMRRAPMVINTAFYPRLMWNSRFASLSGDPFDNSAGFQFPLPEGRTLSGQPHLLTATSLHPADRAERSGRVRFRRR